MTKPVTPLPIALIEVLGSVQPRATLDEDAIASYAELYKQDECPLPPLRVWKCGERHILSRGFHRITGAARAKRTSVPCEIREGTERDAILDAMADNAEHGVRLTADDKRKAVNRLLDDSEWATWTQEKIAASANVSVGLVKSIARERKDAGTKCDESPSNGLYGQMTIQADVGVTVGKDGKQRKKTKPGVRGGIKAAAAKSDERPASDRTETPSADNASPKSPSRPAVSGADRKALYREWEKAIGPLLRTVDRIAGAMGQKNGQSHKTVLDHLDVCTDEMAEWLGVKK